MTVSVSPYDTATADAWDDLVAAAPMGSFLHTRRFLAYHGERFADRSLVLRDGSKLVGVFPAAADPIDERRVISHPGITYGGVVHKGELVGGAMLDALDALRHAYDGARFASLRYKPVPFIYHQRPSADDVYALVQLGARLVRSDLSCAIDLAERGRRSDRRRRGEQKARRRGVTVSSGTERLDELWHVVEENLAERHGARPTHNLDEIRSLISLFPDSIEIATAEVDGAIVAGVVLFRSPRVVHAQYIASNAAGRDASALDAVFEDCIEQARSSGARFFDLGTSTDPESRLLNTTLYEFKSEFGGGGVVHETYELELQP